MPLTQNGKLDRDALPQPEIELNEEYAAPSGDMEKNITGIWAEVLGIDAAVISVNSSFFDLGGHSLLAPILISMISERLNVGCHLRELYQYQTIAAFADHLLKNGKSPEH